MKRPNNYRAFTVSYVPATSTRDSRVSITDNRFNTRKIIPYNHAYHEYHDILDIAQSYLESVGIEIVGSAELLNYKYILFTDNFRTSIKGR